MSIDVLNNKFASLDEDKQQKVLEYVSLLALQQAKDRAESTFWEFIDKIDYDGETAEDMLSPLIEALAASSIKTIYNFQDRLSERLAALDGPTYHAIASKGLSGSSDSFLYARCFVVANGRDLYYQVINNPTKFPDEWFEDILNVPGKAYEKKVGTPLDRMSSEVYESFFNQELWGDKAINLYAL
ncbi:MAG: DUF4240 domain-containing protein [Lewinella sp.]